MTDTELRESLIKEAAELTPVFSIELHRRIMAGVDSAGFRPVAATTPDRGHRRWIGPVAAAAMVAVVVGVVRFTGHSPPKVVVPTVAVGIPAAPSIPNPVQTLEGPAVRNWANDQYAVVDRGATDAVAYVQRQFDMLPAIR